MIHHTHYFITLPKADDEGRLYILLRCRWDRCVVNMSTGIIVDKDKWDKSSGRARRNSFHGKEKTSSSLINAELVRWEDGADKAFASFEVPPTKELARRTILAAVDPAKEMISGRGLPVSEMMGRFCKESAIKFNWSNSTSRMYNVMASLVNRWEPHLRTGDIKESSLTDFATYLNVQGYKSATISKRVAMFRRFITWCQRAGHSAPGPLESPKIKQLRRTIVYLTMSELELLEQMKPSSRKLERIRDMFVFCCTTSLRYSDMQALRWSDITDGCVRIHSKKTGDNLNIEINNKAKAVLDRQTRELGDFIFPRISDQKYNDYIKLLAKEAGLDRMIHQSFYRHGHREETELPLYEVITSHCARRTFICLSLELGIPPLVIMKWTGHDSYESMKPYIEIADTFRKTKMELWNKI